jgi:hypothetical protein
LQLSCRVEIDPTVAGGVSSSIGIPLTSIPSDVAAPSMERLAVALASVFLVAPALAATPGFEQDFSSDTGGFGNAGGSAVTRVTSGGVGGAADAYLSVSNALVNFLGAFSTDPNLVGNLPADGVTGYSFWLRDTGANDDLELHVGVGTAFGNFWLSVPGFSPPDDSWQQFSVDLTDPSAWVQIIGTGTFEAALAASNRLLFRHDLPPLEQNPNAIAADFGLDRIQVLPAPAELPLVSAPGRAVLGLLLVVLAGAALQRRRRVHLSPSR